MREGAKARCERQAGIWICRSDHELRLLLVISSSEHREECLCHPGQKSRLEAGATKGAVRLGFEAYAVP